MTSYKQPDKAFDRECSLSEAFAHDANVKANDAFIAAMARAALKKKETVRPGTFVDTRPVHARRIYGEAPTSSCGSPAAMCMETGARGDGASTLR